MILPSLKASPWTLFPSQPVSWRNTIVRLCMRGCTVTQEVQEIITIKCAKSVWQRAHTCGKTSSKSAVPVGFFKIKHKNQHVIFFYFLFFDETTIYRTKSHPWRCSTSSWKNRETEEAKMQFQPHHGLSAGGRHACTQADKNGGEETTRGGGVFCCWLACSSEAFLLSNIFAGPDLLLGSISATVMFHSAHRRHDIIVTTGPNLTSTFKLQLDFHKATGGIHHRTYNSAHKVLKVCVCQRGFQSNHSWKRRFHTD